MILASEESHASYGGVNLAWLSLASGCIDVLSFIELKDLFASAMTGNSALLALAMSRGDWLAASRSLSALLAFALGVAVGTLIYPPEHQSTRSATRWLLVLELIFHWLFDFVGRELTSGRRYCSLRGHCAFGVQYGHTGGCRAQHQFTRDQYGCNYQCAHSYCDFRN